MLAKVLSRYVFIPTQKFNDVSVLQYSAITYPELLRNVTEFCRSRNVPLVVKIHPHLSGKPRESQEACARGTKHQRHSTKAHEASSPPPPQITRTTTPPLPRSRSRGAAGGVWGGRPYVRCG